MNSSRNHTDITKVSIFSQQPQISFSILGHDDIEEAACNVTNAFVGFNPVTKALQITAEEHHPSSVHICKLAADAGMSIIARDKNSNKFIGCMIIHPSDIDDNGAPEIPEKIKIIYSLLEANSTNLPLKEIESSNKVAHWLTISIDKAYQGCGVAKKLIALQLQYLLQRNYQYFFVEFTNSYAHRSLLNILNTEIKYEQRLKYEDFTIEDRKPLLNVPGEIITCLNPVNALKLEHKKWAESQLLYEKNLKKENIQNHKNGFG